MSLQKRFIQNQPVEEVRYSLLKQRSAEHFIPDHVYSSQEDSTACRIVGMVVSQVEIPPMSHQERHLLVLIEDTVISIAEVVVEDSFYIGVNGPYVHFAQHVELAWLQFRYSLVNAALHTSCSTLSKRESNNGRRRHLVRQEKIGNSPCQCLSLACTGSCDYAVIPSLRQDSFCLIA